VNPSKLTSLSLNMVVNGPKLATQFVYLYNYKTNAYDLVYTGPMSGSDAKFEYFIQGIANYVSTTNQVKVICRAVYPQRLGGQPFPLKFDQSVLEETF